MGGQLQTVKVTGPFGDPVDCVYGIVEASKTAVIEMAGASGITLVPRERLNPLYATTRGVGEVIRDAIGKGCRRFIVGIGGSATNDGGIGMLQALGYGILDKDGKQVAPGAIGIKDAVCITDDQVIPELKDCTFKIACDVTNPLCGDLGCSAVFGPQKGATPEMVKDMDGWLGGFAKIAQEKYAKADPLYPGTGAAGGLGYAFLGFTNAVLQSGISIVLEETKLDDYMKDADIAVTGEGRLDAQTVMGKAPSGVADVAKKYGIPVIAFSGAVTEDAVKCNEKGIDAFFPILRSIVTLDEALDTKNAAHNMTMTVEQAFRLIKAVKA